MAQRIKFKEAKADRSLRQLYLDQLVHLCPESVERVVYDPAHAESDAHVETLINEGYYAREEAEEAKAGLSCPRAFVVAPHQLLGVKRKHPIFVLDPCFDEAEKEPYFLSIVLDHESIHVEQLAHGLVIKDGILNEEIVIDNRNYKEINSSFIPYISEIYAYRNQFRNFQKRGIRRYADCDADFVANVEQQIDWYKDAVLRIAAQSRLEMFTRNVASWA